ncbi:MAG TPA: cupin domain-containing protein [Allosphingosinicella sp.]|jgi:uncharacterized cupin superfamily protein
MPKLDLGAIEASNRTGYPPPYNGPMGKRWQRRLSAAAGLQDFGANHVTLEPGGISSQRHWHEDEDELVVMVAGEAVLVEEEGETLLRAGEVAAFPKGVANGHHLVNRSDLDCVFVAIGKPALGHCHYPDIDLHIHGASGGFTRKDGTPY